MIDTQFYKLCVILGFFARSLVRTGIRWLRVFYVPPEGCRSKTLLDVFYQIVKKNTSGGGDGGGDDANGVSTVGSKAELACFWGDMWMYFYLLYRLCLRVKHPSHLLRPPSSV